MKQSEIEIIKGRLTKYSRDELRGLFDTYRHYCELSLSDDSDTYEDFYSLNKDDVRFAEQAIEAETGTIIKLSLADAYNGNITVRDLFFEQLESATKKVIDGHIAMTNTNFEVFKKIAEETQNIISRQEKINRIKLEIELDYILEYSEGYEEIEKLTEENNIAKKFVVSNMSKFVEIVNKLHLSYHPRKVENCVESFNKNVTEFFDYYVPKKLWIAELKEKVFHEVLQNIKPLNNLPIQEHLQIYATEARHNGFPGIKYEDLVKVAAERGIDYFSLSLENIWNLDIDTAQAELEALQASPKEARDFITNFHGDFNQRTGDISIYYYEGHLKSIVKEAQKSNMLLTKCGDKTTESGIGARAMNSNVTVIGKVVRGVETTEISSGATVGKFDIVVPSGKKDESGKGVGDNYYTVETWNATEQENHKKHMKVGELVAVKGNLDVQIYDLKNDAGKGTRMTIKNPTVTYIGGQSSNAGLATIAINGNLTRDPEVNEYESGKIKATLTVAANNPVANDEVNFYTVELWDERAKVANYLAKGSKVNVFGNLKYENYEHNGKKGVSVKIADPEVNFLDKKRDGAAVEPLKDSSTATKAKQDQEENLPY